MEDEKNQNQKEDGKHQLAHQKRKVVAKRKEESRDTNGQLKTNGFMKPPPSSSSSSSFIRKPKLILTRDISSNTPSTNSRKRIKTSTNSPNRPSEYLEFTASTPNSQQQQHNDGLLSIESLDSLSASTFSGFLSYSCPSRACPSINLPLAENLVELVDLKDDQLGDPPEVTIHLQCPHCSVFVVQCENCGGLMESLFPPSSSPSLSPPSPSPKTTPPLTSPSPSSSSSSSSNPLLMPTPFASPHLSPPSPKSPGTTLAPVSPSLSNSSSSSSSPSASPPSFQSTFCVWCGFLNVFDCRIRKQLELPPIFPISFDSVRRIQRVISPVIYQRAIQVELEKANRDIESLRRFIGQYTNTISSPDATQLYPSVAPASIAQGLQSTSPPLQPSSYQRPTFNSPRSTLTTRPNIPTPLMTPYEPPTPESEVHLQRTSSTEKRIIMNQSPTSLRGPDLVTLQQPQPPSALTDSEVVLKPTGKKRKAKKERRRAKLRQEKVKEEKEKLERDGLLLREEDRQTKEKSSEKGKERDEEDDKMVDTTAIKTPTPTSTPPIKCVSSIDFAKALRTIERYRDFQQRQSERVRSPVLFRSDLHFLKSYATCQLEKATFSPTDLKMLKSLYNLTSPELDVIFEEASEFLHNRFDVLKTKTGVKSSQTTLSEYQLHSTSSSSSSSTSATKLPTTPSFGVGLVSEEEIPVDAKTFISGVLRSKLEDRRRFFLSQTRTYLGLLVKINGQLKSLYGTMSTSCVGEVKDSFPDDFDFYIGDVQLFGKVLFPPKQFSLGVETEQIELFKIRLWRKLYQTISTYVI